MARTFADLINPPVSWRDHIVYDGENTLCDGETTLLNLYDGETTESSWSSYNANSSPSKPLHQMSTAHSGNPVSCVVCII